MELCYTWNILVTINNRVKYLIYIFNILLYFIFEKITMFFYSHFIHKQSVLSSFIDYNAVVDFFIYILFMYAFAILTFYNSSINNISLLLISFFFFIFYIDITVIDYVNLSCCFKHTFYSYNLLNGLMFIHPFFITFFYCLTLLLFIYNFFINFVVNHYNSFIFQNFKINQKTIYFILNIIAFITGIWWAFQELSWFSWWNWDPIELVNFFFLVYIIYLIHFVSIRFYSIINAKLYSVYVLYITLFIILTRTVGFNSLHAFSFFFNNFYISLNILSAFFLLYIYIIKYKYFQVFTYFCYKFLFTTHFLFVFLIRLALIVFFITYLTFFDNYFIFIKSFFLFLLVQVVTSILLIECTLYVMLPLSAVEIFTFSLKYILNINFSAFFMYHISLLLLILYIFFNNPLSYEDLLSTPMHINLLWGYELENLKIDFLQHTLYFTLLSSTYYYFLNFYTLDQISWLKNYYIEVSYFTLISGLFWFFTYFNFSYLTGDICTFFFLSFFITVAIFSLFCYKKRCCLYI